MDHPLFWNVRFMNSVRQRSYIWLFWLLALTGVAVDQIGKYMVFAALYPGGAGEGTRAIIPGAFQLTAAYTGRPVPDDLLRPLRTISADHMPFVNHGALFSLGNHPDNGLIFSLVSLAAACAIVVWVSFTAVKHDRFLCLTLGLILAGTLGNLYDRLVFGGVRDFLHWYFLVDQFYPGGWPVFNLADCCLVCGAGLLLFQAIFLQPKKEEPPVTPATTEPVVPEVVNAK